MEAQPFLIGSTGSSPRVRSRPARQADEALGDGIISACAEQTNDTPTEEPVQSDHLRVCGADLGLPYSDTDNQGSSPRVRSRPHG